MIFRSSAPEPRISRVAKTPSPQPADSNFRPSLRQTVQEIDDVPAPNADTHGIGSSSDNLPEEGASQLVKPLTAEDRSSLITAHAIEPSRAFNTCKTVNTNRYIYSLQPPTVSELRDQLQALGLPSKIYQPPYYSKDSDIPESTKEYAGLTYRLKGGQGIAWLEEWSTHPFADKNPSMQNNTKLDTKLELSPLGVGGWEYASHPPGMTEIRQFLDILLPTSNARNIKVRSQVSGHEINLL